MIEKGQASFSIVILICFLGLLNLLSLVHGNRATKFEIVQSCVNQGLCTYSYSVVACCDSVVATKKLNFDFNV